MNIYVGNLNYDTNDDELRDAFEVYGEVDTATVIRDRFTDRSRGFGFVEMPSDEEAQAAIDGLNETELAGRKLTVNKARPKGERRPRRSGGGYGGDRGGGGYGGDRGGYGGDRGGGGYGGDRGGGGGYGGDRGGGGGYGGSRGGGGYGGNRGGGGYGGNRGGGGYGGDRGRGGGRSRDW